MIEGDLFHDAGTRERKNFKFTILEYLQYWYLFLLAVGLFVAGAFFLLRYTVPQYYVGSTILIKDQGDGAGLAANAVLADEMLKPTKNIDDEIIILKSKSLMERVLSELSFNASYFLEGRVQDMEIYEKDSPLKVIVSELRPGAHGKKIFIYPEDNNSFELGEEGKDGKLIKSSFKYGQQIKKPFASFTVIEAPGASTPKIEGKLIVVFHDTKSLANYYSNSLSVSTSNKGSNVLNVGLVHPVSKKSIDILNKLIEVYKKEAVEDKNLIASSALAFIDERLRYITEELTDVEKNVELYKKQNDLTDVSSEAALYLKSADDYNKQLAELDIQIELLQSIEDYLKKQGDQLVPSSLNIQDPTLLVLISKFNELQMERQRMARTTQPTNPLMLNINEQLNNLRINIGENINNIRNGLIITRQNLVASSAKFEHRKKRVPVMERQLLEINRQQGVKEGLYLYLLQKREESALSLAATVSNFRIIDAPSVLYPINPNKPLLYMIAILMGLALPISILYIRNLLNDKVMDLKDIERLTDTPVLGEIARNRTKQVLVVSQDASSPIVEMFRLIRTNLQFATHGKDNKVILVTSSISGEGKSFFSLNLAASLVLTGKKVVVLGMDLRKPTLLKAIKLPEGYGITNYLVSDTISITDIVRQSNVLPNLFVASSGPVLPSPTELMMSPKMGEFFRVLRESFDYIIVDSAPIGLVADAFTLAPYIDSTLYVVRRGYTPKERLSIIDKVYKEKKLKYPMIVLNDTKMGRGHKYGYGYGYVDQKRRTNGKAAIKKVTTQAEVASVE